MFSLGSPLGWPFVLEGARVLTVASDSNKCLYVGNGVTRVWPYSFLLYNAAHLEVWIKRGEAEPVRLERGYVLNELERTVTYPVDGTGEAPLSDKDRIILMRVVPIIQDTELENQGAFFAKTHERTFDKIVMMIQQLREMLDRAVVGSVDQTGGGKAYAALMAAIDETKRIRDATEAIKNIAGACAELSCSCADAAEDWYNKIGGVFLSIDTNFFANFFILAGVADGGSCSGLDMFINDGGTAATFAFIEPINDGRRGCPADWHIINPAIADTLRGRSIVSGRLLENGEVIFTTD